MDYPHHQLLENDHASEWLGLVVLELGDGQATVQMTLRREMMNGFGITHGGMVFAFADSCFALACNPAGGSEDSITVAAGVDINFLRPSHEGQVLTAVAQRRANMGRSGLYDIQIFASDAGKSPDAGQERGELIAEFRGRSRTVPLKAPNKKEAAR